MGAGSGMECVCCGSAAAAERRGRPPGGSRRFRCRDCGRQFNERSAGLLNRARYPSDVVALVVLSRLRYRLTLRDLSEMSLLRGLVFSHEAVRDWEAKLAPVLAGALRRGPRGRGGAGGRGRRAAGAEGGGPAAATGMWTRWGIPAWRSRFRLVGGCGEPRLGR